MCFVCPALSLLFLLLACVARPLCVNDTARGTHSHDVRLFSLSLSLSLSLTGGGVPRHIRERRTYEHARPRPKHEPNEARARQKGTWLLGWMSPRTHSCTWWLEIVVGRGVRWGGGMIQAVGCAGSGHSGSWARRVGAHCDLVRDLGAAVWHAALGRGDRNRCQRTTVRLAGSYTRWWRKTSRARP